MRGRLEALEGIVAGILWALLVLGLSLSVLTSADYMAASLRLLRVPETSGVEPSDALLLGERLRAYAVEQEPGELPRIWRGEPAFDTSAVRHMEDVRRVMLGARVSTGVAAGVLAVYLGVCVALRRARPLARSMRVGAFAVVGVGVLAVAAGLLDFDSLFSAFHGLFFAPGTWTFPSDSLLIRLLPERFWVAAGASWAVLAGVGATVLGLTARHISTSPSRAAAGEGGSRTGEDV